MVIIHRYRAADEYARFLSTVPAPSHASRYTRCFIGKYAFHMKKETVAWCNAFCPPLTEVQTVVRRMQADPELSQENIFCFCRKPPTRRWCKAWISFPRRSSARLRSCQSTARFHITASRYPWFAWYSFAASTTSASCTSSSYFHARRGLFISSPGSTLCAAA